MLVQRGWEERVISEEKGQRTVHYRLLDTTPSSLLAVVGFERSRRHMTYTVTDEFLRVFGSTGTVHALTKWKSRKAVVGFLSTITSVGGPIFANPMADQKKMVSTPNPKKDWIARFSSHCDNPTDEEEESTQLATEGCDLHVENSPVPSCDQVLYENNVPGSLKPEGSPEVALEELTANKKRRLEEKATQATTPCASSAGITH